MLIILISVFEEWGLGIGDWGLGPIPNPHPQYLFNKTKLL